MRPCRVAVWSCALVLAGVTAGPAEAAWCNVFQVTCFRCRHRAPAVANYAPAACCPQQTCCTTQYVQRCYYQPVTCYQTRTYYEPVTTYRTSHYWEPVTSYRYSSYYDPCTCSCQQVATPVTSYRLRSQCCPVQSWVQRCAQVAVTTYRQSSYWEPVTTCAASPCCGTAAPAVSEGVSPAYSTQPPYQTQPFPRVSEGAAPATGTNGTYDRYYYSPSNPMPKAQDSSYRQVPPQGPNPNRPAAPPSVKLDKIVALPPDGGSVSGQVVRDDQTPRAGAKLMFVSANRQGAQETVTADAAGQFRVTLASGGWLVYVHGADGKPAFHSKIEVNEKDTRLMLVSR